MTFDDLLLLAREPEPHDEGFTSKVMARITRADRYGRVVRRGVVLGLAATLAASTALGGDRPHKSIARDYFDQAPPRDAARRFEHPLSMANWTASSQRPSLVQSGPSNREADSAHAETSEDLLFFDPMGDAYVENGWAGHEPEVHAPIAADPSLDLLAAAISFDQSRKALVFRVRVAHLQQEGPPQGDSYKWWFSYYYHDEAYGAATRQRRGSPSKVWLYHPNNGYAGEYQIDDDGFISDMLCGGCWLELGIETQTINIYVPLAELNARVSENNRHKESPTPLYSRGAVLTLPGLNSRLMMGCGYELFGGCQHEYIADHAGDDEATFTL